MIRHLIDCCWHMAGIWAAKRQKTSLEAGRSISNQAKINEEIMVPEKAPGQHKQALAALQQLAWQREKQQLNNNII